jgi:hypothetical protein
LGKEGTEAEGDGVGRYQILQKTARRGPGRMRGLPKCRAAASQRAKRVRIPRAVQNKERIRVLLFICPLSF